MNKILDLLQAMSNEELQSMTARGFYRSLNNKEEYDLADVIDEYWSYKMQRLFDKDKIEALPII